MSKTITDKWPIRYMRLDDEVFEAVMQLKEKYGSPNKGLRAVLLTCTSEICHGDASVGHIADCADAGGKIPAPVKELQFDPDDRNPELAQANIENFREAFGRRNG